MKIDTSFKKLQGFGSLNASYLVIHETANPGATAKNHVDYWLSGKTELYTHYVADWSGVVYQVCDEQRLCYHIGNGNNKAIGIELCHAKNKDDFEKVYETTIKFAAYILKKNNWTIDRLISHKAAGQMWGGTDHTDPIDYFQKYGKTWAQFVANVNQELAKNGGLNMSNSKNAVEVWSYKNKKLEKVDAYQILRDIRDNVAEIKKELASVKKNIESK